MRNQLEIEMSRLRSSGKALQFHRLQKLQKNSLFKIISKGVMSPFIIFFWHFLLQDFAVALQVGIFFVLQVSFTVFRYKTCSSNNANCRSTVFYLT